MKHIITLTLASLTLTGCGPEGAVNIDPDGGTPPIAPPITAVAATQSHGDTPTDLTMTLNEAGTEYTFMSGGKTAVLNFVSGSTLKLLPFKYYTVGSEDVDAAIGTTPSGAGIAATIVSSTDTFGFIGTYTARIGQTELPTSGNATFTGGYAALQNYNLDTGSRKRISGNVELNANFETLMIDGTVTDRANHSFGGNVMDNVILEATTITSDASFSGTATGGKYTNLATYSVSPGTYAGMIVGANGSEVVGGLQIEHYNSKGGGITLIESGAFVAD